MVTIPTESIEFIDSVVEWFARDPAGPLISLPRVADEPPPALREILEDQLKLIPADLIRAAQEDEQFRCMFSPGERNARLWVLMSELAQEIPRRRLLQLQHGSPDLASHSALEGLEPDGEGLYDFSAFEAHSSLLCRAGHAFSIVPPVESPNASYWLTVALSALEPWKDAKVRLDPFLHGPADSFPEMGYRMRWWGEAVPWETLKRRTSNFGTWGPNSLSRGIQHTQYAWYRDESTGQLEIEELHKRERVQTRGTRYFHAIYNPHEEAVVHLDGALRILSSAEWEARNRTHLKDVDKIGTRIKIFRIDQAVPDRVLGLLCANFFVWNSDVKRFFFDDAIEELQ